MNRTTRDGFLAAFLLIAYAGVIYRIDLRPTWPAIVVGILGTIAFETVAGANEPLVRTLWERRSVQVTATFLGVLLCVGALLSEATYLLTVVTSGLITYLLLLVLVRFGAVAPPRAWLSHDRSGR